MERHTPCEKSTLTESYIFIHKIFNALITMPPGFHLKILSGILAEKWGGGGGGGDMGHGPGGEGELSGRNFK